MKQTTRVPQRKTASSKIKRKSREQLNQEGRERKRSKKHRGNTAGSRSASKQSDKNQSANISKDTRIGSKKPISLVAGDSSSSAKELKVAPAKHILALTPREELLKLESDERLDALLDRLDNGETLAGEEQKWLEKTLDRIEVLMEQLGIELEDEDKSEDMYQLLRNSD